MVYEDDRTESPHIPFFYFSVPSFVVRSVVNLNLNPFTCNVYQMNHNQDKDKSKHPIKYPNNNGRNSFVRVCGHCRYMVVTVIPFSIGAVAVATVHHTMLSAYMASLQ